LGLAEREAVAGLARRALTAAIVLSALLWQREAVEAGSHLLRQTLERQGVQVAPVVVLGDKTAALTLEVLALVVKATTVELAEVPLPMLQLVAAVVLEVLAGLVLLAPAEAQPGPELHPQCPDRLSPTQSAVLVVLLLEPRQCSVVEAAADQSHQTRTGQMAGRILAAEGEEVLFQTDRPSALAVLAALES